MFDGNVDNLINSLKLRASVPTRQSLFNEENFLTFLTEEMHTEIVPTIIRAREDFYLTYRDFKLVELQDQSTLGFGQEQFGLLPFGGTSPITWGQLLNRSIGTRIKDIHWISDAGKTMGHIPRITLEDLTNWGGIAGFYFQGNDIKFYPDYNYNGKNIRVWYYRIPNRLTLAQNCTKVQFINPTDSTITVENLPNANWQVNFQLDIIQGYPGYESVLDGANIVNVTGNVLELDQISQKISPGDWVCPAGYACVAQVPEVAYPLLSQLGSIKFNEAFGRTQEMQNAQTKYEQMKNQFVNMIQPRAEMAKKKIVSRKGMWTF